MKRHSVALSLLSLPLALSACAGNNTPVYHEEYWMYYYLGSVELYCWKIEDDWFGGLMRNTSILKTVEQIERLQEIACPISILKDIFWTNPDYSEHVWVCVVSVPPLQNELDHSEENTLRNAEDILYLCEYFGIDPYYQGL